MPADQQDAIRDGWSGFGPTTAIWQGESFTPLATHTLDFVAVWLKRGAGRSPGTCTISIYATDINGKPTGSVLASQTFNGNLISTSGEYRVVVFTTGTPVSAATKYAWVLKTSGTSNSDLIMGTDNTASYTGGDLLLTANSGATWTVDTDSDFTFAEGQSAGLELTVTPIKARTLEITPRKALTLAISLAGA